MNFWQDIRYTLRGLRQTPGFALTAVAILAIGIGVNAMVFSVTDAALFKGFPMVERPHRLLFLSSLEGCCVSYPTYLDWREQAKSFENMAIVHGARVKLENVSTIPEWYDVTEVSADTFGLVGQKPLLGRDFTEADEAAGAAPVVVLEYGFWERRFARDRGIIGRTLRINGAPTTVVGVMPKGFMFPQKLDMWVPLVRTPFVMRRENRDTWYAFGRLKDGVSEETARAEMATIGKRLADAYPLTEKEFPPFVQTYTEFYLGATAPMVYQSMWGAVGFVLLIVCANLANLMLARSIGRSREISVRIALGAGRWRIIRQLLIESVTLSALGGALGWWLASAGVYIYQQAMVDHSSWMVVNYAMDNRALAYTIAISVLTGILFGLAPAARLSKLDVNSSLKDGGRGSTGARFKHLSSALVFAEMALAVVLLAGAGVMMRSFLNLYNADLGIDLNDMLQAGISMPETRFPTEAARRSFFDPLVARLSSLPAVESVALTSRLPTWEPARFGYELAGSAPVEEERRRRVPRMLITPAYLRTLRASLRSGREFSDADRPSTEPVAIVNEHFASTTWPAESAVGKRLRLFEGNNPGPWLTVVGVISNIAQSVGDKPEFAGLVYLPYSQNSFDGMNVIVRTKVPPEQLATAMRREIAAVDRDVEVWNLYSLERVLRGRYWNNQLYGTLFLLFAAVALTVASIGLYAVIAHSVSQRTQEIGVRIALGGTASDIRTLVFQQGMLPVMVGLGAGLIASLGVNRLLQASLVQVSPSDPATLTVVAAILLLAATCGCLIPARRAMRVDPVVALRHD